MQRLNLPVWNEREKILLEGKDKKFDNRHISIVEFFRVPPRIVCCIEH